MEGGGGGSGVTILLSTYIVTFNIVPNEVCNSPHFMQEIFVTMTLVREGTYKTQTCKQEYASARQIEPRRGLQKREKYQLYSCLSIRSIYFYIVFT